MMYRLSPYSIARIISALRFAKNNVQNAILDDELETFVSIAAVMDSTNQNYVYIIGRDPNKI